MDDHTIARWRLQSQQLVGRAVPSPDAVVGTLLGVQAENPAQSAWAVGIRTTGTTEVAFWAAFDEGRILRTHVLRPTWHYVLPDDIRWLLELTAPRIRPAFVQVQRAAGLTDHDLERSREVVVAALGGGVALTRADLTERLGDAGLPADGQAVGVMLADAELAAVVCSGPRDGSTHSYALLDERAPTARRLDRADALAELTWRYFAGHGPATERDLAYWATMSLTDVRKGLAAVADRLERFDHDGRTYWSGTPRPDGSSSAEPRAHLLQVLDEYHNGYQDSRYTLDVAGVVPRGRPANMGMTLLDGQMIGGLRRRAVRGGVELAVDLFREVDEDELTALSTAAERYGRFLGVDVILAVS